MEERKHLLDYLTQVFTIFGITILAISIICTLLGEAAAGESTMFRLGSGGIPVETVFQYLLFSCIFGWFAVDKAEGWIAFLLCFGICFVISAAVSAYRERVENRRLEDGLENLKKKQDKGEVQ